MGGGKADVSVSGSPTEPRNDYTEMNQVLSDGFPYFDDGAGEIEEIPAFLDFDGTLYYFQSSYDFDVFPESDGFFGFSNSSAYSNRVNTYVEAVATGDYYVSFSTNRFYSYSDNLFDSYVHMVNSQIDYEYEGAPVVYWGDGPVWDSTTADDDFNFIVGYFFSLGDTERIIALSSGPGATPNPYVYSGDGGATWERLTADAIGPKPVWNQSVGGGIMYPQNLLGNDILHVVSPSTYGSGTPSSIQWYKWETSNTGPVLAWEYGPLSNDYNDYYEDKFPGFNGYSHYYMRTMFNNNLFFRGGVGGPMGAFIYADGGSYPNDPAGNSVTTDIWGLSGLSPLYTWWKTGESYVEGARVKDDTGWFDALVNHTSAFGNGPPNAFFWEKSVLGPGAIRFGSWTETPTAPDAAYANRMAVRPAGGAYDIGAFEPIHVTYQSTWVSPNHDAGTSGPPIAMNDVANVRFNVDLHPGGTIWDYTTVPNDISPIMEYATGTLGKSPEDMCSKIIGFRTIAPTIFVFGVQYSYNDPTRNLGLDWMHWVEVWKWTSSGELEEGGGFVEQTTTHIGTIDLTGLDADSGPRKWGLPDSGNQFASWDFMEDVSFHALGGSDMMLLFTWGSNQYWVYTGDSGLTWDFIYTKQEDELPAFLDPFYWTWTLSRAPDWDDDYGGDNIWLSPVMGINVGGNMPSYNGYVDRWGGQYVFGSMIPTDDPNTFGMVCGRSGSFPFGWARANVYIDGRIESIGLEVASEAGFTIRADHINSLSDKLSELQRSVFTGGTQSVNFGISIGDLPRVQGGFWQGDGSGPNVPGSEGTEIAADHYEAVRATCADVVGQVATGEGSAFWTEDTELGDYVTLMNSPGLPKANADGGPGGTPDEDARISIRTLIGMRKIIQSLYVSGWFCACFSYCPCQTDLQLDIDLKK